VSVLHINQHYLLSLIWILKAWYKHCLMAMLRNVIIFKCSRTFAHICLNEIHRKFASHKSCIDENSSVTQNLRHTKVTPHKSFFAQNLRHTRDTSHKSCIAQNLRRTRVTPHKSCVAQKLRHTRAASHKSCITLKFRRTKFASPKIRCVTQKWRRTTVPVHSFTPIFLF
jgi:hypothetical protein